MHPIKFDYDLPQESKFHRLDLEAVERERRVCYFDDLAAAKGAL